jgi:hypothetical protein
VSSKSIDSKAWSRCRALTDTFARPRELLRHSRRAGMVPIAESVRLLGMPLMRDRSQR